MLDISELTHPRTVKPRKGRLVHPMGDALEAPPAVAEPRVSAAAADKRLLAVLRTRQHVTARQLALATGLTTSQVAYALRRQRKAGKIRFRGSKRDGGWWLDLKK